jgi:hypothetical protein
MNINQIKKFSTKSEKYINFYKKIEKISKDLENTPRNKYKILNIIYDNFMSRAFNELYKKDKMYELYELIKNIEDEEILFDIEINKLIHTPWIAYFYMYENSFKLKNNKIFEKYVKQVCLGKLYEDVMCTHLLIKNKRKLNILSDKDSYKLYKVPMTFFNYGKY